MNKDTSVPFIKAISQVLENLLAPNKNVLGTQDYYKSKTINLFALIGMVVTLVNSGVRLTLSILFHQSLGDNIALNSFLIFTLILLLYIIGKYGNFFLVYMVSLSVPLLIIWTFYDTYKFNPVTNELYIINPQKILLLGLIVGALLLDIKKLILYTVLTALDMFLFYGMTTNFSLNWLIPRIMTVILIGGFLVLLTHYRVISYTILSEVNKNLTQEVEVNKKNYLEERTLLFSLVATLKQGLVLINYAYMPLVVNTNFTILYNEVTKAIFSMNEPLGNSLPSNHFFKKFLGQSQINATQNEIIELEKKFFLLSRNELKANIDSKSLGILVEIQDITNLKIVEKLEKNFRKVIMHELRTPTTILQLSVSNLINYEEKLSQNEKNKILCSLKNQSNKFSDLIRKISILTELENIQVNVETIDCKSLLDEFTGTFSNSKSNDLYTFELNNTIPSNTFFNIDKFLILQVFEHLLDNAKKFSPTNSKIIINTFIKDRTHFVLEIIDKGIGIDESELPFIFNKFYKGKNGENLPGEGLGLSISKEIIALHNGELIITSKPQNGTIVQILIPLLV